MAGFRKAQPEQAALKIGMYGLAGSGKTFTALLCAEGLSKVIGKRIAYIDTEHGTDFYAQDVPQRAYHPSAFDFDAIYTRSITEVQRETQKIDQKKYGIIVIDSVTHLWEAAIQAYAGDLTKIGTIPLHAWGKIKKPYKEIMAFLLSSTLHVFILGRQGNEFEVDDRTGELAKVGVRMKAEPETAYEPHILFRMQAEKQKDAVALITAYAEKDRTGILAGHTFQLPTFDSLIKPLLPLLGTKQATVEDVDSVAARDAEALDEAGKQKEKAGADILAQFSARITLCTTPDQLKALGKEITPELKKQMTNQQVSELRDRYLDAEGKLKAK
jgi:hypothetical protein